MKHCAHWIVLLLLPATTLLAKDNSLTAKEKSEGWILLFDGKTLDGWDSTLPPQAPPGVPKKTKAPPPAGAAPAQGSNPKPCAGHSPYPAQLPQWEIVNGTISPCGGIAGYLASKQTYKNLDLTIDFKTAEDTNSGVFVRSPAGIQGYEVQIWKAQPAGYNTGSIVGAGKTDKPYNFLADQWNHYEITADGDHLVVILNGTKTLDVHDAKFSDGRILLQYQKFPIEFKNIKLREIKH